MQTTHPSERKLPESLFSPDLLYTICSCSVWSRFPVQIQLDILKTPWFEVTLSSDHQHRGISVSRSPKISGQSSSDTARNERNIGNHKTTSELKASNSSLDGWLDGAHFIDENDCADTRTEWTLSLAVVTKATNSAPPCTDRQTLDKCVRFFFRFNVRFFVEF